MGTAGMQTPCRLITVCRAFASLVLDTDRAPYATETTLAAREYETLRSHLGNWWLAFSTELGIGGHADNQRRVSLTLCLSKAFPGVRPLRLYL